MEKLSECMERNTIVTTRAVSSTMENTGWFAEEVGNCLKKHLNNDFGDLSKNDKEANLEALSQDLTTDRLLSKYHTSYGDIYIISELYNSDGYDIVTTIMYCEEY